MEDLSLHILDCAQNSLRAGATLLAITIEEQEIANMIKIIIEDNGRGMDAATLNKAQDPFFSTKSQKRIGMGIALLKQATQEADGTFIITSSPGHGTSLHACFKYDHIDRKPLGDIADTIIALLTYDSTEIDIIYKHIFNEQIFEFDTTLIKNELQDIQINDPAVLAEFKRMITQALKKMREK